MLTAFGGEKNILCQVGCMCVCVFIRHSIKRLSIKRKTMRKCNSYIDILPNEIHCFDKQTHTIMETLLVVRSITSCLYPSIAFIDYYLFSASPVLRCVRMCSVFSPQADYFRFQFASFHLVHSE